jgi:hypothetical protein
MKLLLGVLLGAVLCLVASSSAPPVRARGLVGGRVVVESTGQLSLHECQRIEACAIEGSEVLISAEVEQHQYPYAGAFLSVALLISIVVAITLCSS